MVIFVKQIAIALPRVITYATKVYALVRVPLGTLMAHAVNLNLLNFLIFLKMTILKFPSEQIWLYVIVLNKYSMQLLYELHL